jgi:hypothetical protein
VQPRPIGPVGAIGRGVMGAGHAGG